MTSAAIGAQLAITPARASVSASLAHSTLKAALAIAEGAAASLTASSAVSLPSAALTEGVLKAMFLSQMKLVAIPTLVAAGILTTSATLIAYPYQGKGGPARETHAARPPAKVAPPAKPVDESLQSEIGLPSKCLKTCDGRGPAARKASSSTRPSITTGR